ncbi:hypothetical protein [Fictibacillus norfolkensis]|uniref:Uncharacterized protein n=1 Tax=Fictibacillus norfolkensis TaxID=2762233 RepID=A0ABR8SRY0_9BACL|nr:hypothetical protein [Fictibacillus norfolkensis]MBD7966256.1 hypothetical protein [Fictibacillus norfolkensis]
MNFLKVYKSKMDHLRGKMQELQAENDRDQEKHNELKVHYDSLVVALDFEKASKVKQQMKQLETEMETRADMFDVLRLKLQSGDKDAAIEAAKEFHAEKSEYLKQVGKLVTQLDKKRAEYLELLSQARDINNTLTIAGRQLGTLQKVIDWKSPEVEMAIGFNYTIEANRSRGEINLNDYLVGHHNL